MELFGCMYVEDNDDAGDGIWLLLEGDDALPPCCGEDGRINGGHGFTLNIWRSGRVVSINYR